MVISKSCPIMIWTSSKCQDQRKENHSTNNNDFKAAEPELEFAKISDTKVIDGDNNHQEYGNEHTWVYAVRRTPILNDQSGRRKLVWCDDDILEPVRLSQSG